MVKRKSEVEYDVERICDKRGGRYPKYLVKWKGWSDKDSTWEPVAHLTNCMALVRKFEASRTAKRAKPRCATPAKPKPAKRTNTRRVRFATLKSPAKN
jgi:hypothetical protein